MGVTHFDIILDNSSTIYYTGSNVTGRVQLTLDEPKNIKGITIEFLGIAKTSFTGTRRASRLGNEQRDLSASSQEFCVFHGEEEYFRNKYYVTGGSNSELTVQAGCHDYPFSSALPPQLPSSFESEHGHIRYTVTATLDLPWRFNKSVEKVFTVFTPVDLTLNTQAKNPVKLELEKRFCCCWCRSGPLTMVINLPYSGYIPGQAIPLTLEVDNASNVRVENIIVKLVKELLWKVRVPEREDKKHKVDIMKLTLDGVHINGSKCFTQQLIVPSIQAVNLDQCFIIDCKYSLQVTAEVGGCHSNLVGEVPIFLGTVPLYQSINSASSQQISSPNFIPPVGAYSGTSYGAPTGPPYPPQSGAPYPPPPGPPYPASTPYVPSAPQPGFNVDNQTTVYPGYSAPAQSPLINF